jgi:hypothetical protein
MIMAIDFKYLPAKPGINFFNVGGIGPVCMAGNLGLIFIVKSNEFCEFKMTCEGTGTKGYRLLQIAIANQGQV